MGERVTSAFRFRDDRDLAVRNARLRALAEEVRVAWYKRCGYLCPVTAEGLMARMCREEDPEEFAGAMAAALLLAPGRGVAGFWTMLNGALW